MWHVVLCRQGVRWDGKSLFIGTYVIRTTLGKASITILFKYISLHHCGLRMLANIDIQLKMFFSEICRAFNILTGTAITREGSSARFPNLFVCRISFSWSIQVNLQPMKSTLGNAVTHSFTHTQSHNIIEIQGIVICSESLDSVVMKWFVFSVDKRSVSSISSAPNCYVSLLKWKTGFSYPSISEVVEMVKIQQMC